MASSVQCYSISINNSNTNSSPSDGFVDNKTVEQYEVGTGLETTPSGLTLTLTKAKRRGNVRWRNIIQQLGLVGNCYVPTNTINNGSATAKTEGTSFAFQVYAEHGDASLITADELNPGQFLTSITCLARCVARALIADVFQEIDVYDPTSADSIGTFGATTSVPRFGSHIYAASAFEIGAYESDLATAQGFVTVAEV
jgi:hypothetical protein